MSAFGRKLLLVTAGQRRYADHRPLVQVVKLFGPRSLPYWENGSFHQGFLWFAMLMTETRAFKSAFSRESVSFIDASLAA